MTNDKLTLPSEMQALVDDFTYDGANIGFGKTMAPIMLENKYENGNWQGPKFRPYGPLQLDPASKVLHYAQEIFEGMKAYKNEEGDLYLFRPEMNARRFNASAVRMAMPEVPEKDYLESVKVFSEAMKPHVPTGINKSLYLRPFMIATEPTLGVRASETYSYYMIGCLVESYFTRPNVKVYVEMEQCRAAPGGIGFAKTGGNYGASLMAFNKTKAMGFDQTLWLDAIDKKYVEEMSGMNFFAIIGNELTTPTLTETILAGITRESILKIAHEFDLKPVERKIDINELVKQIESGECSEAFACGTASVLTPIEAISYNNKVYNLTSPLGDKSSEIRDKFLRLQRGLEPDPYGWTLKI